MVFDRWGAGGESRKGRTPPLRRWRFSAAGVLAMVMAVACGTGSSRPPGARTLGASAPGAEVTSTDPGSARSEWISYQGDQARTGRSRSRLRLPLTPAWRRADLDGDVYAQPLITNDVVIVATEHDSLYGLDPTSGTTRWTAALGDPVPARDLPCGDIDPVGITGTPVVDEADGVVWAVAFVRPHGHQLVAVDLKTGAIRSRRPVDPTTGFDPAAQSQRAALALAGGRVYIAFGGRFGDCGTYHGWVVAAPTDGGPLLTWQAPTENQGGIWTPQGPTVDGQGRVYVATGNSSATTSYDQGNSVVRLSSTLVEQDSFAPSNWAALNKGDVDIGSVGVALVSGNQVFQIGKGGIGYLLAADHLGGVGGQIFSGKVCAGAYGATAWAPPILLVPCRDGVTAVRIADGRFSVAWRGPRLRVGPPVVSDGVVWAIELKTGQLEALAIGDGSLRGRSAVGQVPHFAAPAVGGGRLVAPAGRGVVAFSG